MIKLFRKIRQNLLAEGKTGIPAWPAGRYLKYAAGEIILVMVGILLALQVNDWNETRKNRILEKYYLERIVEDLETDIAEMHQVVDRSFGQVYVIMNILDSMGVETKEYVNSLSPLGKSFVLAALEYYSSDTVRFDLRPRSFAGKQNGLYAGQTVDLTISTFNELLNNGQLDLITDLDLRQQIIDHYNSNLAYVDIQQNLIEARKTYRSFLLTQNIPARHNMSFEEFMAELNDPKGFVVVLKNYLWATGLSLNSYRERNLFKTQELINNITSYIE